MQVGRKVLVWGMAAGVVLAGVVLSPALAQEGKTPKTVKGMMQERPGGELVEREVAVREVPTDLPLVPADQAALPDSDLVLGVVADGRAVAFPVRYLALYEVVDSRVGKLPVAPTW